MRRLFDRIPRGEGLRFLLAGASNTMIGMANTFLLTWVFVHLRPDHAATMTSVAALVAMSINITISFLTYKWFVFHTKGNYWREYSRSFVVYVPSLLLSTFAVGPLAAVLLHWLPRPTLAPYVAQAIIIAVAIIPQFFGHKKITFRKKLDPVP